MVEPPADERDQSLVLTGEVASEEHVVHAVERREGLRGLRVASSLGEILDLGNLLPEVVGDLVLEPNDEQLAKRERCEGSSHHEQDEVGGDQARAGGPQRPYAAAGLGLDDRAGRRGGGYAGAIRWTRAGRLRVFGGPRRIGRRGHIERSRMTIRFSRYSR